MVLMNIIKWLLLCCFVLGLSVGKGAEIWSQKFCSWQAKLGFSLRPLSNPPLTVTRVRCVMDVITKLCISITDFSFVFGDIYGS